MNKYMDRLDDIDDDNQKRGANGWRTMESAPRDGTRILVLIPPGADGRRSVEIAAWDDERFNKRPCPFWAWERRFLGVATMKAMPPIGWQPLPSTEVE